ncbi:MAG: efflux transporter outer membrane subunit [Pseudomonadota bacterium]
MITGTRGVSVLVLLLTTACTSLVEYDPPTIPLPESFQGGGDASAGTLEGVAWWRNFRDDRMNLVVAQGLDENLNVRIAVERMMAARANVQGAGIAVTGAADGEALISDTNLAAQQETATAELDVTWLLDFFGRLSSQRSQAVAGFEAAGFDIETARLAYISEVLLSYIDARFFQESIALQRQNLASRRRTLDLTQRLLAAEATTRLDAVQAEGLVNTTLADIPGLEASYEQNVNRLATLIGRPAGNLQPVMNRAASQPIPRGGPIRSVPADVLRNRPDVRATERRLAAATSAIGIARADLYPSITLGGEVSVSARNDLQDLRTWSFGPAINLPVFGRRGLNATVAIREAEAREARLAWEQTVLVAVEEVQSALVALDRAAATTAARRNALATFEENQSLAATSYAEGNTSLLDLLDAERSVGTARTQLASAQRDYARAYVELHVALGAGRAVQAASAADDS